MKVCLNKIKINGNDVNSDCLNKTKIGWECTVVFVDMLVLVIVLNKIKIKWKWEYTTMFKDELVLVMFESKNENESDM